MKITNFNFTLRQAVTENSYNDNYYVSIDENGVVNISHPYKAIPYEEQLAILGVIQNGILKYAELVELCDVQNRALELEEYTPQVSVEETTEEEKAIAAAKLSAAQELELALKSSAPQSCALGGGEVSTEIKDAPFEETKTLAQQVEENVIESLGLK